MSGRRLIGIDLAWGEGNGSGCAELAWRGGELELVDLCWLRSMADIAEWIDPQRGEWVIAIDAPLVVLNAVGQRYAEAENNDRYRSFDAGALSSNLTDKTLGGKDHRGGRLWRMLEGCGGSLIEHSEGIRRESEIAERLVLETYPHPVMVELFGLERIFKYKKGQVHLRQAGQQELAEAIRRHLCSDAAKPRLSMNERLEGLLREPVPELRGGGLQERGDKLDAVVCAYVAAWVDRGAPFRALGRLGEGVIIVPWKRWMREPDG